MTGSLLTSFIAADTKLKAGAEVSDDDDEESHVSRFVNTLVKHLLKGFEAKDKNVRYRTAQFIAEIISCIGEIE